MTNDKRPVFYAYNYLDNRGIDNICNGYASVRRLNRAAIEDIEKWLANYHHVEKAAITFITFLEE